MLLLGRKSVAHSERRDVRVAYRGCRIYRNFGDGVISRAVRASDVRECSTECNDQHGAFLAMSSTPGEAELEHIWRHHTHEMKENQCGSILVKHIHAPVNVVWSLVRRFDQPEKYKRFIQSCAVHGRLEVGTVRQVHVVSGLPATRSTERLEVLDEEQHVLSYKVIDGDHRLKNYWSIITLHPEIVDGRQGTLAIESYVVDTPDGNTKEDTCFFVETVIKCNLKSLADVSERLALQQDTERLMRISDN